MDNQTKKIFASFGWITIIRSSERLLGFVTTLILAKYIAPEAFGIIAIAAMLIDIIQIFKDFGISQALIYKKSDINIASITAFWLMVTYNIILFLIAALAAPYASYIYDISIITPVIILFSSNLIWNSFRAVPAALIEKNIDFKKLLVPDILPIVAASVISILMAIKGMGVWSLVTRSLIINIGSMILIWKYTAFRPAFRFDVKIARDMLSYGKYLVGASVLAAALYNVDKMCVSKFIGVAELGYYTFAMSIAILPVSEIGHVVCRVMFPVLTEINQNEEALRSTFLTTIKYTGAISIPLSLGICIYGPSLINILYGTTWLPMVLPLQIFSIYALFRSISVVIAETFKATGATALIQKYTFIRLLCISILCIPAIKLQGLAGICMLVTITYGGVLIIESIKICKQTKLGLFSYLEVFYLPIIISLLVIPFIYYVMRFSTDLKSMYVMIFAISTTIVVYIMLLSFCDRSFISLLSNMIHQKG